MPTRSNNASRRRKSVENATGVSYRETATTPQGHKVSREYKETYSPQRRSQPSQRRSQGSPGPSLQSPIAAGKSAGSIGTLEAEFFGAMILTALTIFTDPKASSDYPSVMLAAMKRGTMIIISFFLLALLSAAGNNAAKFAKAFGALILVGLILAQAENGLFSKLDEFFKSNWTSGGSGSAGSSSGNAQAGTQQAAPGSGAIGTIIQGAQAAEGSTNPITGAVGNIGAGLNELNKLGKGIIGDIAGKL